MWLPRTVPKRQVPSRWPLSERFGLRGHQRHRAVERHVASHATAGGNVDVMGGLSLFSAQLREHVTEFTDPAVCEERLKAVNRAWSLSLDCQQDGACLLHKSLMSEYHGWRNDLVALQLLGAASLKLSALQHLMQQEADNVRGVFTGQHGEGTAMEWEEADSILRRLAGGQLDAQRADLLRKQTLHQAVAEGGLECCLFAVPTWTGPEIPTSVSVEFMRSGGSYLRNGLDGVAPLVQELQRVTRAESAAGKQLPPVRNLDAGMASVVELVSASCPEPDAFLDGILHTGQAPPSLQERMERLQHSFGNPSLATIAFQHNLIWRTPGQRLLAWLGDSVLNLMLAEAVVADRAVTRQDGLLSALHLLAKRRTLSMLLRKLDLDHVRRNEQQYWTPNEVPESVVAEMMESIIGGIFLDSGCRLEVVRCWFQRTWPSVQEMARQANLRI